MSLAYKHLQQDKQIPKSSSVYSSNAFLDPNGLIRIGGRLENADLDFTAKHPIILPNHHQLTSSIINYYHLKYLHAGPQSLLANIRTNWWYENSSSSC